jgi:2-isopropylmalate synthase
MSGFDWNAAGAQDPHPAVRLHDETLRDGLQSPSVVDPPLSVKRTLLRSLARAGVGSACLALPAAGPRASDHARALLQTLAEEALPVVPVLAGRTLARDVDAVLEVVRDTGVAAEMTCFVGASPIRRWVEGWSLAFLLERTAEAIGHGVGAGLEMSFVLEDTTRTPPDTLEPLLAAALEAGATRIVLCDTVGHAIPAGAARLVRWVRGRLQAWGAPAGLDWHGHDDRGLATGCALAAARAGCDRIHGCVLGVGERVGNADLAALGQALAREGAGSWRSDALAEAAALLRPYQRGETAPVITTPWAA